MQRTELSKNHHEDIDKICTILAGPPGAGKSSALLREIIGVTGRYLLAAPRVDLVEEHAARIRDLAAAASMPLAVQVVHSRQPGARGSVDRRLRDELGSEIGTHTVVVSTHAALMGLAPGDVAGWHVRVDELPDAAVVSGAVGLAASWPAMAALYHLALGTDAGWFRVVPRQDADAPGLGQIVADVAADLVELHRIAGSRGRTIEVDVAAWEDAAVPGRRVQWRSIWSLSALSRADSLAVAAAGYGGSLAEQAVRRAGGLQVEIRSVGSPRTGQPRIRIHYFTRHEGSTGWWSKSEGSACLAAIGRHLGAVDFTGYWMANEAARPYLEHRFEGERCRPRIAGTNTLRHHIACAAIYSAKSMPRDKAIAAALGLGPDAIRAAREDEDLHQFTTRGAIRDTNFDGIFDIHLYSLAQAERLRTRLTASGYTNVVLVPVPEAGIMEVERPNASHRGKSSALVVSETAAQRDRLRRRREAERGRRRRAAAKTAKITDGTYRPRGRPRSSINTACD